MIWRSWGNGPAVLLLHGGAGSWMHWRRNIAPLTARGYRVIAPDLPGFGASHAIANADQLNATARALADGLSLLIGNQPVSVAGFSFGGVVASVLCAHRPAQQLRTLILCGSGGMGCKRPPKPQLQKWRGLPPDGETAAHRHNLLSLMIADPTRVDAEALELQQWNARHARGQSRTYSLTSVALDHLQQYRPRLHGIWGEFDATARGFLAEREAIMSEIDPRGSFHVVANTGHWVNFEAADATNAILASVLEEGGR